MTKVSKRSWSQERWCNKQWKLHFLGDFKYGKFWCSPNATNQLKSTVESRRQMCIKSFIFMYISTVFQDFCTKVRIYSLLISNFKLWFLGVVHSAQSGYIPRVWCITESNSKSVCPFKLCLGQNFPSFGYICITNSFPWSKDKWWPWSKVISTRTRTTIYK